MSADPDVLIIGAGPAGLAAATTLRQQAGANVVVLERESEPGGIPRHCDHLGYGIRDLRTITSGPKYAARIAEVALAAGVEIRTRTMVTEWDPSTGARCTSPQGRYAISGRATLLATGARERPRPARMVPGTRPAGVYTTGELQNAVHLHHRPVGSRAVVVGAQLVSWSAVMTLKEAGCATAALVTSNPRAESFAVLNLAGRTLLRTPVVTNARIVAILGRARVSGVEVELALTGERRVIDCDTVVFTGDWIPDHELARAGGLDLDAGSRGPLVDAAGRTSHLGVFAAGNTVHPVGTADVAALGGRHVAASIARYLTDPEAPGWGGGVRITTRPPLLWVSPGWYHPDLPPARNRLLAWTEKEVYAPTVTVRQAGTVIGRRRLPWPASPGRIFRLPWQLLTNAEPDGGPITIGL